jgi:hypothetical protein
MNVSLAAAHVVLADSDKGRGSPIGLFVILVLCVAVYFLWRSLNRHLKRIPPTFELPEDESGSSGTAPSPESEAPPADRASTALDRPVPDVPEVLAADPARSPDAPRDGGPAT